MDTRPEPEEVAKWARPDLGANREQEFKEYLRDASAREIQRVVHAIYVGFDNQCHFPVELAKMSLAVRIAEDQAKTAAKLDENTRTLVAHTDTLIAAAKIAETSNRRIVRLTWALLVVTIGMLALTAVL